MARAGYGSRRTCETYIQDGRVTINGKQAELGAKADPDIDEIRVDGKTLTLPDNFTYIILHKPVGVISDEDVGANYQSARDLIPVEGHLYPVGRLDVPSEGLMLFTNDGDLAHRLTHPRFEHAKTYQVLIEGYPSEETLEHWRRGVKLDGTWTARAEVEVLGQSKGETTLEVVVTEGKKRMLRRIAALLGHPVKRLVRTKIGPLELGDLPTGSWRKLDATEQRELTAMRKNQPRKRRRRSARRTTHHQTKKHKRKQS